MSKSERGQIAQSDRTKNAHTHFKVYIEWNGGNNSNWMGQVRCFLPVWQLPKYNRRRNEKKSNTLPQTYQFAFPLPPRSPVYCCWTVFYGYFARVGLSTQFQSLANYALSMQFNIRLADKIHLTIVGASVCAIKVRAPILKLEKATELVIVNFFWCSYFRYRQHLIDVDDWEQKWHNGNDLIAASEPSTWTATSVYRYKAMLCG